MKKTFLSILALSFCVTSFAQWSNTGNCRTTGKLTVGTGTLDEPQLHVIGPKSTTKYTSLFLEADGGGQSAIRSLSSSAGASLEFATTTTEWYVLKPRLTIYDWGTTRFHDKTIWLGDHNGVVGEEGTQLFFRGTITSAGSGYIAGYTRANELIDLRLSMGNGGEDRFLIGHGGSNGRVYSPIVYVNANGNVGIGTESKAYKLEVNGTIRAKEVRVESGWADFVFKPDYQLPTLQEVKAHIDEHKHLPGMPSEAEVQENGVGLAEMATKLLQKVEELTLYVIKQQETIDKLTNEAKLKDDKK